MNDYERVARVIRYLDARHTDQPDLSALAAHVGLSPAHFHRLFSHWAGVTPKDFLQCLTLSHARRLLREGEGVLETALAAGLSGPGRLHDLCVSLEAASPGEVKSGGDGWTIVFGEAASPFGDCLIAQGPRGICHLSFLEPNRQTEAAEELRESWPQAQFRRDNAWARELVEGIFRPPARRSERAPLRAYVRGSAFQLRVWRALVCVPSGVAVGYGQLACAVGQPAAARAVGSAVAGNCLAYLIPCHRVIRQTGVIGDYRWGTERKRAILAWEGVRILGGESRVEDRMAALT